MPARWYLFDRDGQTALDEVNRRIREAHTRADKARTPQEREQALAERDAAEGRLVDLLAACGKLLTVSFSQGRAMASGPDRIPLPGDTGAMLLRIPASPGPMRALAISYDLSQSREAIVIDVAAAGTTWVVVRLANVPAGTSSLVIHFKRPSGATLPLIINVQAPEPAWLRVNVLSASTSEPVPAMVKLVWKTDGSERRPTDAVDFSAQFDNLGRASAQRHATLPGRLKGHLWWCVAGPFDMPIPPGEWDMLIRHGLEYVPVFDTFTVRPGERLEKTWRLRQWANMPALGWYSGDDHVHAQVVSDQDARRLMTWARAEDVHVVNLLKMGDVYRTWFQQRGFGKVSRAVEGDYALVPGQECPRTHSDGFGHTISLNTTSYVRDVDKYWLYDWVADAVHGQGGLFGFAHAYLTHPYIRRGMSLIATQPRADFAEILQMAQMGTDFYYDWLNLGYRLTASAGSDVPWQGTIGEVRTYAYLGDRPFSPDRWFDAVKRGRTFVTNGPMLDLRVDEAMPGDEIVTRESRKLRVRARAWGDAELMVPGKLEIIRHGEVIRAAEAADPNKAELTLDFEVDSANGFWLAARATGADGSLAHTTPVYVVKEPLRFWKLEAVETLIGQRLANLDDVERMVAEACEQQEQGKADTNLTTRTMAEQAEPLRRRVAEARRFYGELRQTADHERSLRSATR